MPIRSFISPRTATAVTGGQFGDEGKGNGHIVYVDGRKYALRMVPSGFVNPDAKLYIGKGVLVDPAVLLNEIKGCEIEESRAKENSELLLTDQEDKVSGHLKFSNGQERQHR